MNAVAQVHVMAPRRMTPDDYRAERERIRQTYGDNAKDANGLREQALAALYHRSGWTQDELAKVEGISRPQMTMRLLFGRFLGFVAAGNIPNEAIGVSHDKVKQLTKRGMPVSPVARAVEWFSVHGMHYYTKGKFAATKAPRQ